MNRSDSNESSDNPRVFVSSSPIHGRGLFATGPLKAGQLIGQYAGSVVEEDGMHVLWIEEDDEMWVGYDGNNSMRYMNHSDQPNAEMDGLDCYALVDIDSEQEITIDYGWDET